MIRLAVVTACSVGGSLTQVRTPPPPTAAAHKEHRARRVSDNHQRERRICTIERCPRADQLCHILQQRRGATHTRRLRPARAHTAKPFVHCRRPASARPPSSIMRYPYPMLRHADKTHSCAQRASIPRSHTPPASTHHGHRAEPFSPHQAYKRPTVHKEPCQGNSNSPRRVCGGPRAIDVTR